MTEPELISVIDLDDGREIRTFASAGPGGRRRIVLWEKGVELELASAYGSISDEAGRRWWIWQPLEGEQARGIERAADPV